MKVIASHRPEGRRPRARWRRLPAARLACGVWLALTPLACALLGEAPAAALAAVRTQPGAAPPRAGAAPRGGTSLEAAATRAGDTGRAVAMSLIGLAFAVAATVLAFRRDFKEAAGVFAVGIVAVLLATPAGIGLLRDTVASLFGSQ
jgi:hypothetical protein